MKEKRLALNLDWELGEATSFVRTFGHDVSTTVLLADGLAFVEQDELGQSRTRPVEAVVRVHCGRSAAYVSGTIEDVRSKVLDALAGTVLATTEDVEV